MEAAFSDPATAPVDEKVRATLGLLEKLTLNPSDVGPQDLEAVRAAGVKDDAIRDAVYVCFVFNVIDRVSDALEFEPLTEERLEMGAPMMLHGGYKMA